MLQAIVILCYICIYLLLIFAVSLILGYLLEEFFWDYDVCEWFYKISMCSLALFSMVALVLVVLATNEYITVEAISKCKT